MPIDYKILHSLLWKYFLVIADCIVIAKLNCPLWTLVELWNDKKVHSETSDEFVRGLRCFDDLIDLLCRLHVVLY